jgi:K+-sensing histidine kinase KdpD
MDRTLPYLIAGVVLPFGSAAALVPLRDDIDNTNVALLLVVTVVAVAASGRRPAALVAAASSAASFNLLHTQPYGSLRIHSSNDLRTDLFLLAVGVAVGEIAAWGRREHLAAESTRRDLAVVGGISGLAADGESPDRVLTMTAAELTHLLELESCTFEFVPPGGDLTPHIRRDGSVHWGPNVWDAARWGLPTVGADLAVQSGGRIMGRFFLHPTVGVPISAERLRLAATLADQAGAALVAADRQAS